MTDDHTEIIDVTTAWARTPTGRPYRWIRTNSPQECLAIARQLAQFMPGSLITAPDGSSAKLTADTLHLPVSALARLLYRHDATGQVPRDAAEIDSAPTVIVTMANILNKPITADLLAYGRPCIFITDHPPVDGSFLIGRHPDIETGAPAAVRIIKTLTPQYVLRQKDSVPEIVCNGDRSAGIEPGTIFRIVPRT